MGFQRRKDRGQKRSARWLQNPSNCQSGKEGKSSKALNEISSFGGKSAAMNVALRLLPDPDVYLCLGLSCCSTPRVAGSPYNLCLYLLLPCKPMSLLSQFRGPHQAASSYGGGGAQGQSDPVQMAHPGSFLPVIVCRQNCDPLDLQWLEATPRQSMQWKHRLETTELWGLHAWRR